MKLSFTKIVALAVTAVSLANCSNNKSNGPSKAIIDTPTVIIDDTGKPVQTIAPSELTFDERMQDAWAGTDFTPEFLKTELVNGAICSISEKHFVGCFFVARKLSEIVHGKDTILHLPGTASNEVIGEEVARLQLFSVYKKAPVGAPKEDDLERSSEFTKHTVSQVIELYNYRLKNSEQQTRVIAARDAVNPSIGRLYEDFLKECAQPNITDEQDLAIQKKYAGKSVNTEEIQAFRSLGQELNKGLLSDFSSLFEQAFAKIPQRQKNMKASELYNIYLRNSSDAHAHVSLNRSVEDEIMKHKIGVGVYIVEQGNVVYLSPVEGGAADQAGVRRNDKLVKVDGQEITSGEDAVGKIRGAENTPVTLTLDRVGSPSPVNVTILRYPLKMKSYKLEKKQVGDKVYGYLKINGFDDMRMPTAVREFVEANDSQVRGWILDLRGNPGGYVAAAVGLSSVFVKKGEIILYSSDRQDIDKMNTNSGNTTSQEPATAKEPVVLIDSESASASELLSGALQDLGKGFIVGETSFGKGSIQSPEQNHPDMNQYAIWSHKFGFNSFFDISTVSYRATTGRYFLPSGRTTEWVGVTPDVQVLEGPDAKVTFKVRERDDYPFSLPAVGPEWTQKRAELVQQVKACVNSTGQAVKSTETASDTASGPFGAGDSGAYQLAYALDAAECLAAK